MSDDKDNVTSEMLTIRNIMKDEAGRNFIWGQLQSAMVYESIFNKEPMVHAYNSGMREHGLILKRAVEEAAPNDYITMVKENLDE